MMTYDDYLLLKRECLESGRELQQLLDAVVSEWCGRRRQERAGNSQ
jgi:hypothetical protein